MLWVKDDSDLEEDSGFGGEDINAGLTTRLCLRVTVMIMVMMMVMVLVLIVMMVVLLMKMLMVMIGIALARPMGLTLFLLS